MRNMNSYVARVGAPILGHGKILIQKRCEPS